MARVHILTFLRAFVMAFEDPGQGVVPLEVPDVVRIHCLIDSSNRQQIQCEAQQVTNTV